MKKRIVSAVAFVLAVITFVCTGCNFGPEDEISEKDTTASADAVADNTSTAEKPASVKSENQKSSDNNFTAEEIVGIYLENQQIWMPDTDDYLSMGGFRYIFLDLDFDGTLELVVNVNAGSGRYSTNTYFKINESTKKVEQITTDESDKAEFGFDYGMDIKLVKNVKTGKMRYYCSDFVRVWTPEYGTDFGVMYFENNKINTQLLFAETFTAAGTYENTEDIEKFYYHVGDESVEITKADYESRVNAFFAENKDLNLKHKEVDGSEYMEADQSQRKAMLLKSYNAFSYDK